MLGQYVSGNRLLRNWQQVASQQKKAFVGNAQPFLDTDAIRNLRICFPSLPEQQKIASCLSSIDDLITAHTQELETFKTHKKGLMQQLFPALDEVGT